VVATTGPVRPLPGAEGRRRLLRWTGRLGCLVVALVLAPPVAVAVSALLAPYSSATIPDACSTGSSQLPAGRSYLIPGMGTGTMLARDGDTAVVALPAEGTAPKGTAVIVDTRDRRAIASLSLHSDSVAAAIAGGVVYLFDDKIGYLLRPSDGKPLPRIIESDNYRGLFESGGTRYIQTDGQFWIVGLDGALFTARHVEFATIADGCFIAASGG
jgi:hypothetical protein